MLVKWVTIKIQLSLDLPEKIPDGAISALESEFLKRLSKRFDHCQLKIKRASNNGLPVSAVY
ncbi:DinI-like family protein [Enterobacter roggenkampii]|uniref:DinI-like family protein n=1 Tax=Enterobacter roggenkampii TaxID=1812935 RepID=UPI000907E583|nr:DinI-like family protein [Enterobacter roggenkampii]WIJ49760.1 DinI family protein [Enterobacter roggenkampii]WIJ76523.1 DinI family protein [Enterobacter roggenkampii]